MPGYTDPLAIPYPVAGDTMRDAVSTIAQQAAEKVDDLLSAVPGVNPSARVNITAAAGWTVSGDAGVWRRAGMAHLHVRVTRNGNTAWGASATIATVPVGYRPLAGVVYASGVVNSSGSSTPLFVTSAGDVVAVFAQPAGSSGLNVDIAYAI